MAEKVRTALGFAEAWDSVVDLVTPLVGSLRTAQGPESEVPP
jgi:hypothetical protein